MAGGFWRGAFNPSAFWTGTAVANVLDDPFVPATSTLDFDAPTALGEPAYIARPQLAQVAVVGFAPAGLVNGFVSQATLAEVEAEGFQGGLATPTSYLPTLAEITVQGGWPGTQGKSGGLLDTASDPDNDPLSFEIMSLPAHGTLTVEFNGAFLYSPNRGFSGTDGFTWRPWAGGEAGNTVAVTLLVEQVAVAITAEVSVETFTPTRGGIGLFAPAELGEISVTGFVSTGLLAGFVGTASLAEVTVTGFVSNIPPGLQALEGDVDVQGFTGTLHAGFIQQATRGPDVGVEGLAPILSRGLVSQATLAEVEVEGFFSTTVGYVERPLTAEVSVSGFASRYLELPLQALEGTPVTVTGFTAGFNNIIIIPPPAPERPSDVVYYDPRNHLPPGRILDRDTEDDLMVYWAQVNYRVLTDTEMYILIGDPLPTPSIKREFGTGRYPEKKVSNW